MLSFNKIPGTDYVRHEPEKTILYRTLQENFETFIAEAQSKTDSLPFPMHVYQEVDAYLACGILSEGFARVRCESCKHEKFVAFSCKRRGFCPSCGGRRMNEVAAHLVDNVFPNVPVRQWVISFPFSVRYLLAFNPLLVTKLLDIYIRAISTWYVKAARKNGIKGKTAAVTFVQRFGGAVNANVHFHSLFFDGVYSIEKDREAPQFYPVFPPTDEEMLIIVRRLRDRMTRFLNKNGYEISDFSEDPFAHEQPVLSTVTGASIFSRIGLGERAGQRVRRVGQDESLGEAFLAGKRCAVCDGFSLHANVQIKKDDRKRLEKLCRYAARPPIALERMSETPDGKILYKLKTRYSDGTTHVLFDPLELVEKVVALIPPPRANLLRYHGLVAPNCTLRSKIVPLSTATELKAEYPGQSRWAQLLKRSFAIDVLCCTNCGGKMKVISTIRERDVIEKILTAVGLPYEPVWKAPPRAPPQIEMSAVDTDRTFSQLPSYQPEFF